MPRKTAAVRVGTLLPEGASMRPRPDAAENAGCGADRLAGATRASMRPRPDAAENVSNPGAWGRPSARASMRPRPDAAENHGSPNRPAAARTASMRPRPDAAENPDTQRVADEIRPARFNEAAARCRGKPSPGSARGRDRVRRFNEAAARCRGKLFRPALSFRSDLWLQ